MNPTHQVWKHHSLTPAPMHHLPWRCSSHWTNQYFEHLFLKLFTLRAGQPLFIIMHKASQVCNLLVFFFKHNAFAPPKWSHSVLPPSTEKVVRNCRPGKKWHFQRVFPIDSKHSQLINTVTQHEAYCNSRYFPPWPVGLPPDATDRSPIPIRAN